MTNTASLPVHALVTDAHLTLWASPSFADEFNECKRDRWGNSGTRRDRLARLWQWQEGLCVKCGEHADLADIELSHHIAATAHGAPNKAHAGVFYGNVSAWHTDCNRAQGDRNVRIADLARADLIFTGKTADLPKMPK